MKTEFIKRKVIKSKNFTSFLRAFLQMIPWCLEWHIFLAQLMLVSVNFIFFFCFGNGIAVLCYSKYCILYMQSKVNPILKLTKSFAELTNDILLGSFKVVEFCMSNVSTIS